MQIVQYKDKTIKWREKKTFSWIQIGIFFCSLSGLGFFQSMAHEAGEKCQNHLWIHFHQIVRQSVHPGTDLTSQWDGVPGRGSRRRRCHREAKMRAVWKTLQVFVLLLGISDFVIFPQKSSLGLLHHVPLDRTRSNDVNQINHGQTGADGLVLHEEGKYFMQMQQNILWPTPPPHTHIP